MTHDNYRTEGSHLYQYDPVSHAYIHCYQDTRTQDRTTLIRGYERLREDTYEDTYYRRTA